MVNYIVRGGWVMIPLLACSVLAVAISLERLWYLLRTRIDTEDLMEDVKLALGQGKVLEAMQIAKRSRGPVAAIIAAGIAFYDREREEIKEHMHEVGRNEIYKMEKRMAILEALSALAPMLGLLGTVTGIIHSFDIITAHQGAANAVALSSGISEALITTATGLIIAVPTLAIYSYLSEIIDRNIAEMNKRSNELIEVLSSRGEY